jgi:pimeloyl-ACP methyl ester carboxylesterase
MTQVFKKWLRKKRFYFSLALLGFLVYSYKLLELRLSDKQLVEVLSNNPYGLTPKIDYLEKGYRKIRFVEIGQDSLPLIVFIHGAPSSSNFWESLMTDTTLLKEAKLLAVDRPGYGYSGFGKPEVSVEKQAALIADILQLKKEKHETIIAHGSSYGGTVVARLAMDYPELLNGILLQSASLAPGEEKTYWISYPTSHWLLRWLMPPTINVANAEKLNHRPQLEKMAQLWDRIKATTIIMHGTTDELIYPENAYFAKEKLINAQLIDFRLFEGRGHDLLWNKREELIEGLQKLLRSNVNPELANQ